MKDRRPLCRASSVTRGGITVFRTLDKSVTMQIPGILAGSLIEACDGTRTYEEVVTSLKNEWDEDSVQGLVDELFRREIIVDARMLSEDVWKAVENPALFSTNLSDEEVRRLVEESAARCRSDVCDRFFQPSSGAFESLLSRRRSVRRFSGETIPFQSLVDMLWSAYGEVETQGAGLRKTTPSAGALYPLIIHLALLKGVGEIEAGVYRICYGENRGVGFTLVSLDVQRFVRAFLNPKMLYEGAQGVIVVSGSFVIAGEKYGNRSLMLVPLEAGHAAQNVMVQASEHGVASVEVGGFVDNLVRRAIELPDTHKPLTTIVFGKESTEPPKEDGSSMVSVDWAVPMAGTYCPPFAIASARFSPEQDWSNGRDASPEVALLKAIAETREWSSCGSIPPLMKGRESDIKGVVDPRSIIKFHPSQYRVKWFPFAPLDATKEYEWTKGHDVVTGAERYILADLVYFPYFPETQYYAFANSSGCAAHPNEQTAIETGTLELIERDAFMNAYLARLVHPTIRTETLPEHIQQRINDLRDQGFNVWVKDYTLDLAPAVLVFAQNDELTFTTCAACASFDTEHAVSHALMEVEASVLYRLRNGLPASIKPDEVGTPLDHGRLYAQRRYYRRANFLVDGGSAISFGEIGKGTARMWGSLLDRFDERGLQPIIVPLHLSDARGGNGGLHIIRSIVPGLIPMTFGSRQEPGGMGRIYSVAAEFGGARLSYGDVSKFPHPFE